MGADEAIVVGKGEIPQAPSSKLDILLSTVPAALDWVPYIDFLDSDKRISKVVQAAGFIRGINPKSKIENPQAPAFIRGVNLKSKI